MALSTIKLVLCSFILLWEQVVLVISSSNQYDLPIITTNLDNDAFPPPHLKPSVNKILHFSGESSIVRAYFTEITLTCKANYPIRWDSTIPSESYSLPKRFMEGNEYGPDGLPKHFRYETSVKLRINPNPGSVLCLKLGDPTASSELMIYPDNAVRWGEVKTLKEGRTFRTRRRNESCPGGSHIPKNSKKWYGDDPSFQVYERFGIVVKSSFSAIDQNEFCLGSSLVVTFLFGSPRGYTNTGVVPKLSEVLGKRAPRCERGELTGCHQWFCSNPFHCIIATKTGNPASHCAIDHNSSIQQYECTDRGFLWNDKIKGHVHLYAGINKTNLRVLISYWSYPGGVKLHSYEYFHTELMQIFEPPQDQMVANERVTYKCSGVSFLLGDQIIFGIQFRNNSVKYLDSFSKPEKTEKLQDGEIFFRTMDIILGSEMTDVICMSPRFDSYLWYNITAKISLLENGLPARLPPFFVKQPSSANLLLESLQTKCENNQSIVLECEAEGYPAPKYSWIKDGKEVNFQADNDRIFQKHGRGTLLIKLPRSSDVGQYQCLAKNELGTSISNTVFLLKAEVSTIEWSENVTMAAEEGKPFNLSCSTPRGPKTSVHWIQQNSQGALRNISSERITAGPEGHLWFSVVTTADKSEDYYYACAEFCPLRNETKIWSRIYLNVTSSSTPSSDNQQPPMVQYTSNRSTFALKGHGVDLWCIFSGMPLPNVTWAFKGRGISWESFQYKNNKKTLRIPDVDFSDEGTYDCIATNGVGQPISHSINLSVFAVPYFTLEPEIQNLEEGQTAVFRCEASGKPSPEIRWIHNGAPMDQAPYNPRRKLVDGNQVVIENLTKGDTGNYGCNASNSFSYVYKDVYVNVRLPTNEHGQRAGKNDTAFLIACAMGVFAVIGLLLLLLLLWRKYKLAANMIRNLTQEEVDEFHRGKPGEGNNEHEAPLGNEPYNENKIIRSEDLQIESTILGEGHFGIVHKGILRGQCVAVKCSKSSADVEYFKAFLKEIKVMAYIGDHENIVRFYGAVVDKIEERICPAVMELSPLGDLNSYLLTQSKAPSYVNVNVESLSETSLIPEYPLEVLLNRETLLRFCIQIAAGMDYLAQKKVIHGDLAARNVLVFADNVVKITDFGLSRKLYNCVNYTKKNACSLPWRWMAIESLRFFEFSIKSDVWSFGVTMWEILSLAEIPFSGFDWTTDFVAKLESGFRLAKPKRCTPMVFEWMNRCWEKTAETRPTFAQCVTFLSVAIHDSQINENVASC